MIGLIINLAKVACAYTYFKFKMVQFFKYSLLLRIRNMSPIIIPRVHISKMRMKFMLQGK